MTKRVILDFDLNIHNKVTQYSKKDKRTITSLYKIICELGLTKYEQNLEKINNALNNDSKNDKEVINKNNTKVQEYEEKLF